MQKAQVGVQVFQMVNHVVQWIQCAYTCVHSICIYIYIEGEREILDIYIYMSNSMKLPIALNG